MNKRWIIAGLVLLQLLLWPLHALSHSVADDDDHLFEAETSCDVCIQLQQLDAPPTTTVSFSASSEPLTQRAYHSHACASATERCYSARAPPLS